MKIIKDVSFEVCYIFYKHAYHTPILAKEPSGILLAGSFKSPLILTPANTPQAVGKNTPKTVKNETEVSKPLSRLFSKLKFENPVKPSSKR